VSLRLPEGGYQVDLEGSDGLKAWFVTVRAEGPRVLQLRWDE
jgi:hypothetical protein